MELFRIRIGTSPARRTLVVTGEYLQQFPTWRYVNGMVARGESLFFIDDLEIYDASGCVTESLSDAEINTCYAALHSRVIARKRLNEKAMLSAWHKK